MNKTYIEVDANGRIIGTFCLSQEFLDLNPHMRLMESNARPETHYINIETKEVLERLPQKTVFYKSKLHRLPVPCTIFINGTPYECDSSTAELEFDQPTTYEIRVESWPYQDWETTYENQA